MATKRISKHEEEWLKVLGKNLEKLIHQAGYESSYDFWQKRAGDDISRTTLHYIIRGEKDPKATTLRVLARLLEVKVSKIVDVWEK